MTRTTIVFSLFWLSLLAAGLLFGFSGSLTIRNATQYLEKKLEAKMDINYYFYDQFRTQANNKNSCHSGNGPYCPPINNKTFSGSSFPFIQANILIFWKLRRHDQIHWQSHHDISFILQGEVLFLEFE